MCSERSSLKYYGFVGKRFTFYIGVAFSWICGLLADWGRLTCGLTPLSIFSCSYLLEDEDEPYELFPEGLVSPAISILLRVLTAGNDEFNRWQGIEDVLKAGAVGLGNCLTTKN